MFLYVSVWKGEAGPQVAPGGHYTLRSGHTVLSLFSYVMSELHHLRHICLLKALSSATEQASQEVITLPSWGKQTFPVNTTRKSADIALVQSRSVSQSFSMGFPGTHSGENAFPTQVLTLDGSCLEEAVDDSLLWCLERLVHTHGLAAVSSTYCCLILIKAWRSLQDRGAQPLGPRPLPPVRSAAALD